MNPLPIWVPLRGDATVLSLSSRQLARRLVVLLVSHWGLRLYIFRYDLGLLSTVQLFQCSVVRPRVSLGPNMVLVRWNQPPLQRLPLPGLTPSAGPTTLSAQQGLTSSNQTLPKTVLFSALSTSSPDSGPLQLSEDTFQALNSSRPD